MGKRPQDGTPVGVTLHLLDGRIHELEIWDGTFEPTRGAVPDPATLKWKKPE